MNKKILFLVLFLFLIPNALAERQIINYAKLGTFNNGVFQETTTPISDFSAYGYICSNNNCDFQNNLWNPINQHSTIDSINLTYPTQLQSSYGYGIYFFKDGYIPYEVRADWWGTNPNDPQIENIYLSKIDICSATIDSFSVINEAQPNIPIVINTLVKLDATAHSAIQNSGPLDYIPSHLQNHYSVTTQVTLQIFKNSQLVHQEIRELNIPYSGQENVEFTWIPTLAGDYIAKVSTYITDNKCIDSTQEYSQKNFVVLEEPPTNMCYTLLNNLEVSNPNPVVGDFLTFTVEKISNYADEQQDLHPTQAELKYEIKKSFIIKQGTIIASTQNPETITFNWNTQGVEPGQYIITVKGKATHPDCEGIENPEETISMTLTLGPSSITCTTRTEAQYGSWIYEGQPNQPPIPILNKDKSEADINEPIIFNAQNSYDTDGQITSYYWDFGDFQSSTLSLIPHSYSNPGTKHIALTVTDNGGSQVRHRTNTLKEIEECSDGSSSIINEWTEEEYESISLPSLSSTVYTTVNIIEPITCEIITDINYGDWQILSQNQNPSPIIQKDKSEAEINELITFNALSSFDDDLIISYLWDFGDGSTSTSPIISHSYSSIGTKTITLTVTDNGGELIEERTKETTITEVCSDGSSTLIDSYQETETKTTQTPSLSTTTETTINIHKELIPPVAIAGFDRTVKRNEIFELDAGRSYDPDGYIVEYEWNLADGRIINKEKFEISYPNEGIYNIELKVTDNDNLSSTDTIIINVLDKPLYSKKHDFRINNKIIDYQIYSPGDEFEDQIRLRNLGHLDEENIELTLDIHELDIHLVLASNFDLDSYEVESIPIQFIIPKNTKPGEYLVKITAKSDDYRTYSYSTILVE